MAQSGEEEKDARDGGGGGGAMEGRLGGGERKEFEFLDVETTEGH